MTSTENLERQQPTCQCGCCGPTATALMEPPAAKDDKADGTCQCGCASTSTEACKCGCTDTGCECGCGDSSG